MCATDNYRAAPAKAVAPAPVAAALLSHRTQTASTSTDIITKNNYERPLVLHGGSPPRVHRRCDRFRWNLPGGQQSCPGGGDGRSVLAGEKQRDEQSNDLVVRVGAAVLVLHVYEHLDA